MSFLLPRGLRLRPPLGRPHRCWGVRGASHDSAAVGPQSPAVSSVGDVAGPRRRPLPIAAFIDLDNVGPGTFRREDAADFVRPLRELARKINGDGCAVELRAFGNLATRTHRGREERGRGPSDQAYIPWTGGDGGEESPGVAQSGLDEDGSLRCGVCGARMKLSKKKRAEYRRRGIDDEREMLEDQLVKHMDLHTREQRKRKARVRGGKGRGKRGKAALTKKEREKYDKYEAAVVGLGSARTSFDVDASGKVIQKGRNDLFRVLKEAGVRVTPADDVDDAMIKSANAWLEGVRRAAREAPQDGPPSDEGRPPVGVLAVYSRDSDFVPLLEAARRKRVLAVSVTDGERQTRSLVGSSDVVLGRFDVESGGTAGDGSRASDGFVAFPVSSRGLDFMRARGGRGTFEEGSDQIIHWDLVPRPPVTRGWEGIEE